MGFTLENKFEKEEKRIIENGLSKGCNFEEIAKIKNDLTNLNVSGKKLLKNLRIE